MTKAVNTSSVTKDEWKNSLRDVCTGSHEVYIFGGITSSDLQDVSQLSGKSSHVTPRHIFSIGLVCLPGNEE